MTTTTTKAPTPRQRTISILKVLGLGPDRKAPPACEECDHENAREALTIGIANALDEALGGRGLNREQLDKVTERLTELALEAATWAPSCEDCILEAETRAMEAAEYHGDRRADR